MKDSEPTARSTRYDGVPAAFAFACSVALLVGRWLPVRFTYRENDLGIVSIATLQRYPLQQETFWYVFSGILVAALTFAFSLAMRRLRIAERRIVGLEALGAGALLFALWRPATEAAPAVAIFLATAVWLARRPSPQFAPRPRRGPRKPRRRRFGISGWVACVFAISLLLVPGVWAHVWNVAHYVPDEQLTFASFRFQGEIGQHLAWALELVRGGFHGRDFFCLYGPLFDWSVVGMWALLGRSIAVWNLYWSVTHVLGWIALFLVSGELVRRPALVLLLPLCLPYVSPRIGLALLALLCVLLWLRSKRIGWIALAGAVTGTSLFYSHEFGLAAAAVTVLALLVRGSARSVSLWVLGLAATLAPVAGYYAANDALAPMLQDLIRYPGYVMAGYAKIPFPAIESRLMWDAWQQSPVRSQELRIGYALPAIFVAALVLALPISAINPARPIASLGTIWKGLARDHRRLALVLFALFGLIVFRSALGRTDRTHMLALLPAAAVLIAVAVDQCVAQWRVGRRTLGAWRLAALALFLGHSGFLETASPASAVRSSLQALEILASRGNHPVGNRRIEDVSLWIRNRTDPGDAVLFLPNNAAYYYLTDRRNPIRFVLGSQIVTEAHREEVLADLKRDPPRYVVWDDEALRIDDLSDEIVFGRNVLDWIESNYSEEMRFGGVGILGANDGGRNLRGASGHSALRFPSNQLR